MSTLSTEDRASIESLLPLVYDELRKYAAILLAKEPPGQTLQATAIVNEAYLRVAAGENGAEWKNRNHFFAAAAITIRRILVDNARRKKSLKRGGGAVRQNLHDDLPLELPEPAEDLVALDDALNKLTDVNPQAADVVQLVYFSGLSLSEAASTMQVSPRSVDRLWAYARAWLRREMRDRDENS